MENKEDVLGSFFSKMGYLNDETVLGIVKYEGYIPGYSYEKSDIGLYYSKIFDFFSRDVDDVLVDMEKMIVVGLGSLLSLLKNNSPYFFYNYYLLLEQIKQLYIKLHDLDDFTTLDAIMLSGNSQCRDQFNQGKCDDFFAMYMDSIIFEGSNLEKFEMLCKLYNYVLLSKEKSGSLIKKLCNNT